MASTKVQEKVVVVDASAIEASIAKAKSLELGFRVIDDGVFNSLGAAANPGLSRGIVMPLGSDRDPPPELAGHTVLVGWHALPEDTPSTDLVHPTVQYQGKSIGVRAWVYDSSWVSARVQVVPVKDEIFSRNHGLLESAALAGKRVFVKALGSVGSTVARFLAQSGICHFTLMDHDRLEVSNVVRHEAGVSHIGRYKTKFMADLIREKNPHAQVVTHEVKSTRHNLDLLREIVRGADLCIDTGDEREGKLLMNRVCLEEKKPVIFSGAFRRAHGAQVLRVRPYQTACYACFVKCLTQDGGLFPAESTESVAYSDRPVPIEPGLSIDIDPVSQMTAKLAIQELIAGMDTTLRSLDEDLAAHWYLWVNRREMGTQYERWDPLGFDIDGLRILRWFGVSFDRDPACPMCGNSMNSLIKTLGVSVSDDEAAAFAATLGREG